MTTDRGETEKSIRKQKIKYYLITIFRQFVRIFKSI